MMAFKLAWRNIWRNRRRTFITVASVMFAVFFSSLMTAIQTGTWDHMVDNVVKYYFGYLQIHAKDYWNERSIDLAMEEGDTWDEYGKTWSYQRGLAPRLESFALASYATRSQGVVVVGFDPLAEQAITNLQKRLSAGQYPSSREDDGVWIGEGLGELFKAKLGDTLTLISQGYHGANAAGLYVIKGLIHFASPELSKTMLYLPLGAAQRFFAAEGLISTLVVDVPDKSMVPKAVAQINASLSQDSYEVMDWQQMMPDLLQAKAIDEAGSRIMLYILYFIVAFGIFGTILMMTRDRRREFGVLISIGMRRRTLGLMVWIENLMIGLMGVLAGFALSVPIIYYLMINPIRMTGDYAKAYEKFGAEPVIPTLLSWGLLSREALLVFVLTTILALYPLSAIWSLKPVEAMRN